MKKQLTKDITRYDEKMKLKFDAKTFKAVGIGFLFAAPTFFLLYFTAGSIPAVILSVFVLCALVLLQVGTIQGMTMSRYLGSVIKFAFIPKLRKKPYSREKSDVYSRLYVLTEDELKQERRRENAEKRKEKKR